MSLSIDTKPKISVGAGGWESLSAALDAGADAIYAGLKQFNLRANARNFELNQINKVVRRCHEKGVLFYLTLNGIVFDDELKTIEKVLQVAKEASVDAIICWDFAIIEAARRLQIPFHISTQASVSNTAALDFYAQLGAERIVLARECSLDMIKNIIAHIKKKRMPLSIESFIHGALCISVSGRCFMSEYLFGRSANRGDCIQPCRREYRIYDLEEGHEMQVGDGYVLSPKDICALEFIEQLIETGIHAFKIEGRTRPAEYIYTVTSVYREAIDSYYAGSLDDEHKKALMHRLEKVYHRGFSEGFYFGVPSDDLARAGGSVSKTEKTYVGEVIHYFQKIKVAEIVLRNSDIRRGDELLFTGPTTGVMRLKAEQIEIEHKAIEHASRGMKIAVKTNAIVRKGDKVFLLS